MVQLFREVKAFVSRRRMSSFVAACGWIVGVGPTLVQADTFELYRSASIFQVPADTGPMDVLDDGRIIILVGDQVLIESSVGSRKFELHGTLVGADIPFFGAAFLRVSPDGTKIAVGNNGGSSFVDFKVGVLDFNTLAGTWFSANHFVGEWIDNTLLAIAAGDFGMSSGVTVLNTLSPDPLNPINTEIVDNIGGASGGIEFDVMGNLFVGNGFSTLGPSQTGTVMFIPNAAWMAALGGGSPVNFETQGTFIVKAIGATPLGFDGEGNLFLGGGGNAPDNDAIALVRASAVMNAVAGMGSVDAFNPQLVRRFDPIPGDDFNFFSATANPVTHEIYIRDFGASTINVYRAGTGIPAASQWGMTVMGLLTLTAGTIFVRRM